MNANIIVSTSAWVLDDIPTLFDDEFVILTEQKMLPNLLVELGIYKSTSEARRAGRVGEIPKGYTEMKASKKFDLYIWNPA